MIKKKRREEEDRGNKGKREIELDKHPGLHDWKSY